MLRVYALLALALPLLLAPQSFGQNYLDGPWSVTWDSLYNRYLVNSYDNGRIVSIDTSGQQSIFRDSIAGPTGCHISGDTLFVSTGNDIIGFNLADGSTILEVPIPTSLLVDGIASDTSGYLYCVDMNARRISRIDRSDLSVTPLITSGLPLLPHNLLFDAENNRLLLSSGENSAPIMAIQLPDGELSVVVVTPINGGDGITEDAYGNIYISSFSTGDIFRYDSDFTNPPFLFATGYNASGSISYNKRDAVLAIPHYYSNSVSFVRDLYHIDSDGDAVFDADDNCPETQNPDQENSDSDAPGDSCDNCILVENPDQEDSDGDAVGDSCDNCIEVFNPSQTDTDGDGIGNACDHVCGDADGSEAVDIDDVVFIISYIFAGGPSPDPIESGDPDCSGAPDIDDVVYLITYIFAGGPAPCDPDGDEIRDC